MLEYRLTRGKYVRACDIPFLFRFFSSIYHFSSYHFFSPSFLPSISILITHPPSHPPSFPLCFHHSPSFITLSSLPPSLSPTLPPCLPISHPSTPSPSTTRTPGPKASGGEGDKGCGFRGPGETKMETDKRAIREKIVLLTREISLLGMQREQHRRSRHVLYSTLNYPF